MLVFCTANNNTRNKTNCSQCRFKGLTTLLALGLVQNFDIINLHCAVDTLEVRYKTHSFAKLCRNLNNSRFLFNLARIAPFYTYSFLRKGPFHALCGQGGRKIRQFYVTAILLQARAIIHYSINDYNKTLLNMISETFIG